MCDFLIQTVLSINLNLFDICVTLILFVIQTIILHLISKWQMSSGPHGLTF